MVYSCLQHNYLGDFFIEEDSIYDKNKISESLTKVIAYDNTQLINAYIIKERNINEKWKVEFYKRENGIIPVMEFLLTLSPKMRAKAYSEIELLKERA